MSTSTTRVPCERVDLDYFDRAQFCVVATEIVRATPERIFELFLDGPSWTKWVMVIDRVDWTSPEPIGLGSTRSVFMKGGMVGHEEFIAWDAPNRMSFRFNETSKPMVAAFAEDYHVTDLGDGSSRIHWRMAMTPLGVQRHLLKPFRPAMTFGLRYTLRQFRKYAESNPQLGPSDSPTATGTATGTTSGT